MVALDLATQKEIWAARVGPPHADGPRCTPTVDGELLYALGTDGDLVCLETATGKERWHKSFVKDFGGQMMSMWKFSESPLVDGDRLICTPGGKDAAMVALNKKTGEVIWKSRLPELGPKGKDGAGYSSAVVAEIDGVRQYVQIVGRGAVGVAADTGKFLWGYNRIANEVANIPTPIVRGNYVFVTTSYNTGAALLKISRKGDGFVAEEVYHLDPNRVREPSRRRGPGGRLPLRRARPEPRPARLHPSAHGRNRLEGEAAVPRFGRRALCRRALDLPLRPRRRGPGRGHSAGVPRQGELQAGHLRRSRLGASGDPRQEALPAARQRAGMLRPSTMTRTPCWKRMNNSRAFSCGRCSRHRTMPG